MRTPSRASISARRRRSRRAKACASAARNCPRSCKKKFRWRRPRHTLKGRQPESEMDRKPPVRAALRRRARGGRPFPRQEFGEAALRCVHALHYLGLSRLLTEIWLKRRVFMARSLSIQPSNIQFIENYATVLCQLGEYRTALESSLKGCDIDSANNYLLYLSAVSFLQLRRLQNSLLQFDKLLAQDPNHIVAINERGTVLLEMKRYSMERRCEY